MRLIDADALNDIVEKSIAKFGGVYSEDLITGLRMCVHIAMEQPTQPEIIHCRKCKHWVDNDGFNHEHGAECSVMRMWMQPDDYCSYAKRREVIE